MKKPVLFLIFNRPDTTQKVFEAIRAYQPQELFIAADGPRQDRAGEEQLCEKTREIALSVDWDCKVHTLFREKNLGCKYGPCTGITWFFEHVEEGIVLEDDCVASPDFFRFCEEMLDRYRNEEKVMHISGMNFQDGHFYCDSTYFFSMYPYVWGWASWRRAWKYFEAEMGSYEKYVKDNTIAECFPDSAFKRWRFLRIFRKCYEKEPYFTDVWDYVWAYSIFCQKGLCIVPRYNLVSNIGLDGTHVLDSTLCNTAWEALPERLVHPEVIEQNRKADDYAFYHVYKGDWRDLVRFVLSRFTGKDWM